MDLIPVKKSTLATWCRDIELTEDQMAAIMKRRAPEPGIPRNTNRRRLEEIQRLRSIARDQLPELVADPLFVGGLVLYWAEGAKSRGHLSMANTDPRALRLFIRWVRTFLNPIARSSMHLHLHEGNDEFEAQQFWRQQTGLEKANFHKTFIKPKGTGHRKNHLKHGICTVKMRRPADAWNVVMEWIDAFAEEFGLDAPLFIELTRAASTIGSAGRS